MTTFVAILRNPWAIAILAPAAVSGALSILFGPVALAGLVVSAAVAGYADRRDWQLVRTFTAA
ncbi:MAG: hypothetical protein QOH16_3114 [Gaiellaceae bacterium]|jgi:hypothetical protein|nr:hypothetical protein [Gaiellaceae bacterium]